MKFIEAVKFGREAYQLGYEIKKRGVSLDNAPEGLPKDILEKFEQLSPRLDNFTGLDIWIGQIGGISIGPIKYIQTSRYFYQHKKAEK